MRELRTVMPKMTGKPPRTFIPLFSNQPPFIPRIRRDSEGSDGFPAARTGGPGDTPPVTRSRSGHHQNANARMGGSVPGGTNKVFLSPLHKNSH